MATSETDPTKKASNFLDAVTTRRSHYKLGRNASLEKQDIVNIIRTTILHCPSSFNSQSTRLLVLLGKDHDKFWHITKDVLKAVSLPDAFATTEKKVNELSGGYGTILFYEDPVPTRELEKKFPLYATNFATWAEHTNAMHQYIVWTALHAHGLGCNLQHYNPIIDQRVAAEWDVDPEWVLKAQLPFGEIQSEPKEKSYQPWEDRVRIIGL